MTSQLKRSVSAARVERKLAKKQEDGKDNPRAGVMWYLFYCFIKALAMICASLIFDRNSSKTDPTRNLQPFQMIFARSSIALITMVLWQNVGLKKAVWDGVKGPQVKALIFRSSQGAITNTIGFSLTKYLPLTMIAIFGGLGPIFTVILAYLLLKETIKCFELVILLLSLAAVLSFSILGKSTDAQS